MMLLIFPICYINSSLTPKAHIAFFEMSKTRLILSTIFCFNYYLNINKEFSLCLA